MPDPSLSDGSPLSNLNLAVSQKLDGVTGDQSSAWQHAGATPATLLGMGQQWAGSLSGAGSAWGNINAPVNPGQPDAEPPTPGEKTARTIRAAQQTVGAIMGTLGLAKQALDVGFATLTAPLAALFPSLPAATLGSLYIGTPHAHVKHPPSGPPPVPPTPCPSLGPVLLSTCVRVLINNMPAARCLDIGLAPTCCSIPPGWFKIERGSSNVFIGGMRAARLSDLCKACPTFDEPQQEGKASIAAKVAGKVMEYAPTVAGALGIAADVAEAAVADSAAMAAAKALSAAMASAQMAADAAKMAVEATMWKDDPVVPPTGSVGAIVDPSHANVLIGGFPMINIPDPATALLGRLGAFRASSPEEEEPEEGPGTAGGASCH